MSRQREALIRSLVDELSPVRPAPRPGMASTLWLGVSWTAVVAMTLAVGPMRPGFASQLVESPQLVAEVLLGLAAGAALIIAAFRLGIPEPASLRRRLSLPVAVAAAWVLAHVAGLWHPAIEPSMLGKREACVFEVVIYSVPILVLGLLQLRRAVPLARGWTGAAVGAAAGSLPAMLMQLACMYDPAHILVFHLAPVMVCAVLGAIAGRLLLPRL